MRPMATSKNARRFVIAWVDHEKTKVGRLTKKIGERNCGQVNLTRLDESCVLVPITLNLGTTVEKLATTVIDKLKLESLPRFPDMIFVDINLGPPNTTGEDRSLNRGIQLASALRIRLPTTPIGLYTGFHLKNIDKVRISMMHFAAVLENIIDLSEGQDEQILTGDQWLQVFEEILKVAKEGESQLPYSLTPPSESDLRTSWDDKHPVSRSLGFMRAAPRLVAKTLEHLPGKPQITMSQLSGGFSGSFLVKAKIAGGAASFVVKIDEDPDKLTKELEGHHIVESRLQQKHYLPISGNYRTEPAMLTKDWWGAFAMAYELDAKPLIEQTLGGSDLAHLYEAIWTKCLFSLYGTTSTQAVTIASILPDDFRELAENGWESLGKYHQMFSSIYPQQHARIGELLGRLAHVAFSGTLHNSIQVPWAEHIHGDLNCRNVLYDSDQKTFRLLDFPHVGPPNALPIDFVKAEAELMLLIADWSTGMDCDFQRLNKWESLSGAWRTSFIPPDQTFGDAEIDRVFEAIRTIREIYLVKANGAGDVEAAYRLYLFSRVLKYLNYSDLTVAKRHFAFIWASELLNLVDRSLVAQ
jgi:hypothetical protein